MNGQKYDYRLYEYEPVVEDDGATGYFVQETVFTVPQQPLAQSIVAAPPDGVLFRPVSEVFSSARGSLNNPDNVLSKPVGELLSSARESLNDSVLSRPVREVFGPTAARRRRLAT